MLSYHTPHAHRYRVAGKVLGKVSGACKWADGKIVKAAFDADILALLGPKTEADSAKVKKKKDKKKKDKPSEKKKIEEGDNTEQEADDFLSGREIPAAINTDDQMKRHLAFTKGKVITRFPPEPNGHLHIGHAKAMNFNFGVAKDRNGHCIMRFDDTNPEAEKKAYIDNILENVLWMGHKPWKVTYSSDYFQELYELAVKLIKVGLAYVCHQTGPEIEQSRKTHTDSPYRTRTVEENLKLFDAMKKGKYAEGEAILRMKGDMQSSNAQMWDMIAYRIKYCAHPHIGSGWCIYPSYDFTHCIVDSLENITHSLCTLEFEARRESYFWLLDELDLYKPKVWEYSRLNVDNNVLSKRRLIRLVNEKHVRGWDDPRLLTINGLRRRGFTAEAITKFTDSAGVTRNANSLPFERLENAARACLNDVRRAMVIHDPIKVVLTNLEAKDVSEISVPDFPQDKDLGAKRGVHAVPFSKVLYIEREDFKKVDPGKKYYRLAPGKEVHLKYAYNIKCNSFEEDANGKVTVIKATVDFDNKTNCKGHITWVAESTVGQEPLKVELRLYEKLFCSKNPMELPKSVDWITDLNPNSETIVMGYADSSLAFGNIKAGEKFQLERAGYYCVDTDTSKNGVVLNRTCKLKESKFKN